MEASLSARSGKGAQVADRWYAVRAVISCEVWLEERSFEVGARSSVMEERRRKIGCGLGRTQVLAERDMTNMVSMLADPVYLLQGMAL